MSTKKAAGVALMVAFTGAFIAWSLLAPPAMAPIARSLISAGLALCVFLVWRFLVWEKPRGKI